MKNDIFIRFIVIGIITAAAGAGINHFTTKYETGDKLTTIGLFSIEIAGFFMLFASSSIKKSNYFNFIKASAGILAIGIVMKLLSLPLNQYILLLGGFAIITSYFFRFLSKKPKLKLDVLKFVWMIITIIGGLLYFQEKTSNDYQIASSAIMGLAILEFLKLERKNKTNKPF